MQTYWLTNRQTGEATLVDSDTVERLLGVEFGYVEWCIRIDGVFENGKWRVWLNNDRSVAQADIRIFLKEQFPQGFETNSCLAAIRISL